MKKDQLRREYKLNRNALSLIERQSYDQLILQHLKAYPFQTFDYLLSYYPIEKHNEPNTLLFTSYLKEQLPQIHICKPRITDTGLMDAIEINANTHYIKNKYHIHEPEENHIIAPSQLDIVFVPLLAFDDKGYRVGFGKGFYDKYLPLCKGSVLKIGFSYFPSVDIIDDRTEYDIPLDLCFTPFEVYEF